MTPEDLEQSRRHAARMSDQELGAQYVRGPESWAARSLGDSRARSGSAAAGASRC